MHAPPLPSTYLLLPYASSWSTAGIKPTAHRHQHAGTARKQAGRHIETHMRTPRHPLPPTCCHHTRGHGAPQESNPTLCRLGCHKASHNRVTSAHEEGWEESSEGWAPRFWSVMALRRLLHGYRVPEAHANVRCLISRHAAERQQCGGAATSPHCQVSSTIVRICRAMITWMLHAARICSLQLSTRRRPQNPVPSLI